MSIATQTSRSVTEKSSSQCQWLLGKHARAHGVVASHPLRMRKALGSNPSVSIPPFKLEEGSGWGMYMSPCVIGPAHHDRAQLFREGLRGCERRVARQRGASGGADEATQNGQRPPLKKQAFRCEENHDVQGMRGADFVNGHRAPSLQRPGAPAHNLALADRAPSSPPSPRQKNAKCRLMPARGSLHFAVFWRGEGGGAARRRRGGGAEK